MPEGGWSFSVSDLLTNPPDLLLRSKLQNPPEGEGSSSSGVQHSMSKGYHAGFDR